MTTTDLTVTTTIRDQIGSRALFMIGAYNLCADKNSLQFRIKGSHRVNFIKVTYNYGLDLYRVEFGRIRDFKYTTVSTFDQVYCDQLCDLIEKETGLYTHF